MSLNVDRLKRLYNDLLLTRLCERQIMKEYFQDEMKTPVHLGIGAEAIAVGVHAACKPDTQYFGTYRNHAIYLACSQDLDGFFGEMYGKVTGCAKGKAGSMHMSHPESGLIATSAVVATTIPLAAGAALAARYLNQERLVVCFFGDGAIEEGVFFETLNFASLKKLPILFVCEDNDLAIHSTSAERKGFHGFEQLAKTFDLELIEGDGSNIVEVYEKTEDLTKRMRASGKPGVIHLKYFRFLEHVGPLEDFDKGYRAKPADAQRWDPVLKMEEICRQNGITNEDMKEMERAWQKRIDASVAAAKAAPFPEAAELFRDVYAPQSQETH